MAAAGLSFVSRDKEHLKLFDFNSSEETALTERKDDSFPLATPKAVQWSPDGLALALADPVQGVQVVCFNSRDSEESTIYTLQEAATNTQSFIWSPGASVLVTIAPGSKGSQEPNMHVWRKGPEGFALETTYCHPKVEKNAKVLAWNKDESLAARLLPDGRMEVLSGKDLSKEPLVEMKLKGAVQSFEFAPVHSRGNMMARIALFVPDTRDDLQRVVGPAEVSIWELMPAGGDGALKAEDKVAMNVASGQVAEMLWNSTGSAVIAHCQTEVDESGQSYYGGSKLVLVSNDGAQKDLLESNDTGVASGSAVQAVAWSPTRDEFIFIHGFQPSQASLFSWDEKAKKVKLEKVLLEKAHRNTIRFNHFGSLVCLAGFGNLAGQVDFFGRADDPDEEKCDFVKTSSCQANCTVSAEWAPDGRHFLTAVLAPRMRVDNGVSIWRALTGTKVDERLFEELFDTQWRPEPAESIRYLDISPDEISEASKEAARAGGKDGAEVKKQAYRPPKARGETANTVAAMMRGEVAAPDENDRRKRQPRQVRNREEEPNPSPRPDDPPWGREDRREHAEDAPPSPERPQEAAPVPGKSRNKLSAQQVPNMPNQAQMQQNTAAAQREEHQRQQREAAPQQAQQQRQQQQREMASPARPGPDVMNVADAARMVAASVTQGAGYPGQQRQHPGHPQDPRHAQHLAHQQHLAAQQHHAQQAAAAAYGKGALSQLQQQQLQQHAQQQLAAERQQQQAAAARAAAQQQAAAATQGLSSHGLNIKCPATGWQYVDPKQNVQGPFTLLEMQQWNSMGYFRPDLPMRCDGADQFVPFAELFPHPLIPFQSYPKRPGRNMPLR